MRIGIVSQSYYPRFGGVTEHVHYTAEEFARRGHEVSIITSHFRRQDSATRTSGGVNIVRIGRNVLVPFNGAFVDLTVGLRLKRRLQQAFTDARLDVVHIHGPAAPTLPWIALTAANCPTVGTFHMTGQNLLQTLAAGTLRRRVDRLHARIAVSPTAYACAQEHFPGNYAQIPNGVDIDRFNPKVTPFPQWRDDEHINIVFVGRLDPRKGVTDLLAAAPQIVCRSGGRARLFLIGDSPLRARYEASVPPAMKPHVHFLGSVPAADLPHWYATADICVSPATGQESFGIVLLEAMAAGRALVCSDLPGYRSAIEAGRTALVHAPGDADGIANAVLSFCESAPLRESFAAAAREHASKFAWSRIADRIEHIYNEVAPASPASRRAA